ncbi:MAG: polysaccharide biosynthesis C-terminal domain-containing protein [Eubacterium sp.]|nr:polysaccharide biosynthesis C-terminal domain-containing protein [Eubacterium sp.]
MSSTSRVFAKYVSQSVMAMIGISIYILADTFFISLSAGVNGLAILNMTLPVYGLVFALGAMVGMGHATRYNLQKSAGKESDHLFFRSLIWALLISIPFILLGIFWTRQVLELMGASPALAAEGESYLRIALIGAPCFMANYTFTSFVRNDHAPTTAMVASLAGSGFNIIFDYIFVFPVGMGMAGAALATVLSPVVTSLICCSHLLSPKNQVGFGLKGLSLRGLASACSLGISGFVGEISSSVTILVFNFLILGLAGETGVAAYGVIANIALVAMAIFNGVAQGCQPLFSEQYGRGQMDQVRELRRRALILSEVVALLIILAGFVFTDLFIGMFNSQGSQELVKIARPGMRIYFLGFALASINIVVIAYNSAIGKSRPAVVGALLRGAIAISLFALILSQWLGMTGIWLSFLASEALTLVVVIFLTNAKR